MPAPMRRSRPLDLPVLLAAILVIATLCGCKRSSSPPDAAPGAAAPAVPPPIPEEPGPGPLEISAPPGALEGDDGGGAPAIEFETLTHDFRQVKDGLTNRASFPFRNTGEGTLRIAAVKSNCACAAPRLETWVYAPGERGRIDIVYDPRGRMGRTASQVTILSNAPAGPVTLRLVSTVEPLIWFQRVVQVGTIPVGELRHTEVDFYAGDPRLEVLRLAPTHPSIEAKVLESAVHDSAGGPEDAPHRWKLVISIGPGAPWGVLVNERVDVTVRAKPGPGAEPVVRTYELHLRGSVVGRLRADPETAHLGVLRGDQPIEKRITLSHVDARSFTVVSAAIENPSVPGLAAEAVREGDHQWRITLRGRTGDFRGPIQGDLVIETDVPGEERIELRFTGYAR